MNTNHDIKPGTARRKALMWRVAAGAALSALLLTGCANTDQHISIGDMASGYNREILHMSLWPIALSVLIFLGVSGALFYTVSRFREENNKEEPQQFHGNNRLEVILVIIPVVIVLGLSVLAVRSLARLNARTPQAPSIEAMGRQFWWQFSYHDPADPNTQKSPKDAKVLFANGNEMVMPTGQRVAVTTSSMDVVHGFWAPNIGGQRASVPGGFKTWEVDTDREAVYQGNCAQLCGASHANMRYKVIALNPERYKTFVDAATAYSAPTPAAGSAEERGMNLFMQGKPAPAGATIPGATACAACHTVKGTSAAGKSGPDLSFFGTRRTLGAGMWETAITRDGQYVTDQWSDPVITGHLRNWIKHSSRLDVKPGSLMPSYDGTPYLVNGKPQQISPLTDAEIDDIIAYLKTLKLPEEADYWKGIPISGQATAGTEPAGGTQ